MWNVECGINTQPQFPAIFCGLSHHCTLYSVECGVWSVELTHSHSFLPSFVVFPIIVHCTLYIDCTLYIAHCTLHIAHCTLIVHCTLCIVKLYLLKQE